MKKILDWYKALPQWQRSGLWCVAGSAGVWLLMGAAAALGFGLGVLGGFNFGHDYAEGGK
jgi:hypothetical protein